VSRRQGDLVSVGLEGGVDRSAFAERPAADIYEHHAEQAGIDGSVDDRSACRVTHEHDAVDTRVDRVNDRLVDAEPDARSGGTDGFEAGTCERLNVMSRGGERRRSAPVRQGNGGQHGTAGDIRPRSHIDEGDLGQDEWIAVHHARLALDGDVGSKLGARKGRLVGPRSEGAQGIDQLPVQPGEDRIRDHQGDRNIAPTPE